MTSTPSPIDLCAAHVAVKSGTIRAVALLEAQLEVAHSVACQYAFTRLDADAARVAAHAADAAQRERRELGPLAGLAVCVKDLFDVAGQVTTAGATVLSHQAPAREDAVGVARLRTAGAALMGRNQMTEFAFSGVGINPHQGTPANAALARLGMPGRIPGGSSSGGGVAVAAGAAWAALGSDTGGSIRIPAALQGLVGYKNTQALTPLDGTIPLSTSLDTTCAITRSVRDAICVHAVLAHRQPVVDVMRWAQPGAARGLRLGVANHTGFDDMEPHVAQAIDRALQTLSRHGADIRYRPLAPLADTAPLLVNGGIVGAEAWRWHQRHIQADASRYDPRVLARIQRGAPTTDSELAALHVARQNWIARVEAAMGDIDLWLMPTVPLIAPRIADLETSDDEFFRVNGLLLRNPSLINLLDGCAISLPCQAPGATPVGLMLWSRRAQDDQLLSAALAIEAALAAR